MIIRVENTTHELSLILITGKSNFNDRYYALN